MIETPGGGGDRRSPGARGRFLQHRLQRSHPVHPGGGSRQRAHQLPVRADASEHPAADSQHRRGRPRARHLGRHVRRSGRRPALQRAPGGARSRRAVDQRLHDPGSEAHHPQHHLRRGEDAGAQGDGAVDRGRDPASGGQRHARALPGTGGAGLGAHDRDRSTMRWRWAPPTRAACWAQVAGLPAQLERAAMVLSEVRASRRDRLPCREAPRVLVCGMGGSAIGGDIAAVWAAPHGVRIAVHRGYGLPAWVDRDTLLVFSSYSGNTEETLLGIRRASAPSGAARLCIATGGALAARSGRRLPSTRFPAGCSRAPRSGTRWWRCSRCCTRPASCRIRCPNCEATALHLRTSRGRDAGPKCPKRRIPRSAWRGAGMARLPVLYTGCGLHRSGRRALEGPNQRERQESGARQRVPRTRSQRDHGVAGAARPAQRRAALTADP